MLKRSLKRIEALFHQTADLAPEERARFLNTHCASDTELRTAVEELLKHDTGSPGSDSFLASPILRDNELFPDASPPHVLPAIPGYELIEELGRGGMGVVYKARQIALDRFVAVKMLLSGPAFTAEHLVRFRTEAEALARLQHPNIVQVYDVGKFEGRPYFSMEYVAGPNLAHKLAGVPQPARSSAQLVEVVARAVDAVHRCGVLHRDLKPANILLRPRTDAAKSDEGPCRSSSFLSDFEPKVSDFGLAKLVRDQPGNRAVTEPGQALGTPSYMAPEQAWGRIDSLGPATDVYALGAILYEVLSGRPPFEGETPADTILQLLFDDPVPPTRLRRKLPPDLETICLKCLEKEPRKRYASAEALAEDLRRFQAGEPIKARPISTAERAFRWCSRNPMTAALLAVVVALGLALIAIVCLYIARLQQDVEDERQELVQRSITIGMRSLEEKEAFQALLWFTEALRLDQGDVQREQLHRIRIAMALRQCPRLAQLLVLDQPVVGIRLSEAGSWIVTAGQNRSVHVWNVMTGAIAGPDLEIDVAAKAATISPDGRLLAAVCVDKSLRLWNRNADKPLPRPLLPGVPVSKVAFGHAGRLLLVRHADLIIERWDLTTWQPLPMEGQPQGRPRYSSFGEDGKWIFMVDANRNGHVWNAETGKALGHSLKLEQDIVHAALSPDGQRAALVDTDNQVTIWEVSTARPIGGPLKHGGAVRQVAFSPQGDRILTIGDHTVQLWQVKTGQPLVSPWRHDSLVTQAQFSPDGRFVVSGGSDNQAFVWDTRTGQPVTPPLQHHGSVLYAAFSPDSDQVLTIGKDNTARLWELPATTEKDDGILVEEPPQPPQVTNPGGRQLTELENGNAVRVIDAVTEMTVGRPLRHRSRIERAVLSPDGRFVLTASDDNTAQVWDAASGVRVCGPCEHKGTVRYAAFSSDGRRIITASEDHTARVWETMTGEPLTPPLKHQQPVVRAYFSPDGNTAITVCGDGTARAWRLTPDDRPVATLVLLARVLAGSHVDEKYGILPLDNESLRSDWQKRTAGKSVAVRSSRP
jgi:WD40 repeat protein/serine/threonine protein kinase